MRKFDEGEGWNDLGMNLMGVNKMKGVVPQGVSALHFMLWKFTLIQLTLNSLQGCPINPHEIIDRAVRRLHRRTKTLEYELQCEYCKSDARETELSLGKFNNRVKGIGYFNQDGKLILHEALLEAIAIAT